MSSRSTKPTENRCPECGKGVLRRDVVSKVIEGPGGRVRVDGLLPDRCSECRALVWPNSELERAREIVAIKLRKAAA